MTNRPHSARGGTAPANLPSGVDLMILTLLAEEPGYGYSIQKRLQAASRGLVQLQAGTLYPLLHRLEVEKLVSSRWEESTGRRRKYYALTAAGRRRLQTQGQRWTEFVDALRPLLEPILSRHPGVAGDTA